MFIIEIIAVVFSLACVYLTIKRNILCWPVGLVGTTAYGFLFYENQLNADMTLQVIFTIQGIIGWWQWKHGAVSKEFPVTNLKPAQYFELFLGSSLAFVIAVLILKFFSNSSVVFVDTFVSIGSIAANWLLVKKKLQSWIIWVIVDAVYIGLFLYKGLYLSSALYLVFLIMAIRGYVAWKKDLVLIKE